MIGLKKGSKGMDVVGLQKILGIKADGKFGPITQKHLKTFQKANGLYEDGGRHRDKHGASGAARPL